MDIGIPCDCFKKNINTIHFPYRNFLITVDGNTLGIEVPENLKRLNFFYDNILQEYALWYYHGCPHESHFIEKYQINHHFYENEPYLKLIGSRKQFPILYKLLIDLSPPLESNKMEFFYIPYDQVYCLIEEIKKCQSILEEMRLPKVCCIEPFEEIFAYEKFYSKKIYRYVILDGLIMFLLKDKILFSLEDAIVYPKYLLEQYEKILSQNLPFKYHGEKTLFTSHFYSFRHKEYPEWSRIVDLSTGRFIDLPSKMNFFIDNEYCEIKIIPCPVSFKDYFTPVLNKLLWLANLALSMKKPLIASELSIPVDPPEDDEL